MRNYRPALAKWQTADPLGYPDGWNQLAYCGNGVTSAVDLWGCKITNPTAHIGLDGYAIPSVGINEAEVGYHEIIPPYQDLVADIISLAGKDVTIEPKVQKLGSYTRSEIVKRWSDGKFLNPYVNKWFYIDYENWVREVWCEYSIELLVTKETALSIINKKISEGGTVTSIACLIAVIPGLDKATTLAGALSLVQDATTEQWGVQDRILKLDDVSKWTNASSRFVE